MGSRLGVADWDCFFDFAFAVVLGLTLALALAVAAAEAVLAGARSALQPLKTLALALPDDIVADLSLFLTHSLRDRLGGSSSPFFSVSRPSHDREPNFTGLLFVILIIIF